MADIIPIPTNLSRPRRLAEAARAGAARYRRKRHLHSALGAETKPEEGSVIAHLLRHEAEHDETRRSGSASYNLRAHVLVLSAIYAEVHAIRNSAITL